MDKASCRYRLLIGAALCFLNVAHAEYRCDSPPTYIDRVACDEARQGPDALLRYIQRMRIIENLYFYDYVNEERLLAWQRHERLIEPPLLEQFAEARH